MAATSLTESAAAFDKQAANLGLHEDWLRGLKRMGLSTLGRMAFAAGQPGSPVTDEDVRNLLNQAVGGRPVTVGDLAVMKRLIFEAQTAVVALARAQADPAADPGARKMPQAERMSRIATQRGRLTGIALEGTMEVAHLVYDTINGMMEADSLKYLRPSKCLTRMQEITSAKPPKELKLDTTGSGITVKDAQTDQVCPTSTDLDVMEAMTRRSLAFDACGLIDFGVFQKWVQYLFQMMRQPAPPGFKQPSITQLLRADRQAFVRMQEMTRTGIRPLADGTRPLDAIVEDLPRDHTVMYYMMPTQAEKAGKPAAKQPEKKEPWKAWGQGNKQQTKTTWQTKQTWKQKNTASSGTGKLPLALQGCVSAVNGKRICFAYNIDGCDKAEAGAECPKGWHLCATKGCGEKHPRFSCPSRQ